MMKTLLAILLASTQLAHAHVSVKPGNFTLGNCEISVMEGLKKGTIKIRATEGSQFAQLVLNLKTGTIESVNACNDLLGGGSEYSMSTSRKTSGGFTRYSARCGGSLEAWDSVGSVTINNQTGEISAISADVKLVSATLGRWHSGPIKETLNHIECR